MFKSPLSSICQLMNLTNPCLQFKSILPDRMAKFDVSVAGPLAGGILSLSMLAVGLWLSVSPEAADELVQVPSLLFQGSLLLGALSRAVIGYE
jgi:hypothetical protein